MTRTSEVIDAQHLASISFVPGAFLSALRACARVIFPGSLGIAAVTASVHRQGDGGSRGGDLVRGHTSSQGAGFAVSALL